MALCKSAVKVGKEARQPTAGSKLRGSLFAADRVIPALQFCEDLRPALV